MMPLHYVRLGNTRLFVAHRGLCRATVMAASRLGRGAPSRDCIGRKFCATVWLLLTYVVPAAGAAPNLTFPTTCAARSDIISWALRKSLNSATACPL